MKNMKSKLLASVAMLLVSAIMLTSASFAWFTISTAPEISNMTTQVVVNDNLEIALAKTGAAEPGVSALGDTSSADAAYTWGNILDMGATGNAKTTYDALDKTLRPAALTNGVLQYPTYGNDGRLNTNLSNLAQSTMDNGFGNLTGENSNVYGYYVDFWLRSNKAGTVTLSTAADRGNGQTGKGSTFTANGTTAADKVLAENIKIAFKDITGDKTGATGTASAATVAAGTTNFDKVFSHTGVVELTANTPKLIRMYVYLDGAAVTNASASLSGATPTTIGGKLNVQFAMSTVATPMDVKPAAAPQ